MIAALLLSVLAVDSPAVQEPGTGEARAASFDFELLPAPPAVDVAAALKLEHEARVRRSLIQWHQGLGIATVLLVAATVVSGQLDYSDRFAGPSTGQYEATHTLLEGVTTAVFAADGLLALFAPTPYPKEDHSVSSLTVHRFAMLAATVGFASEVPLGIATVAREGHADQPTLALIHLIVGYFTAAAVTAGVTALAF